MNECKIYSVNNVAWSKYFPLICDVIGYPILEGIQSFVHVRVGVTVEIQSHLVTERERRLRWMLKWKKDYMALWYIVWSGQVRWPDFVPVRKPVESVPANFLSDLVGSNQYARVYCGDTCSCETTERTNKEKNTKLVEGRVEMTGRGELWHTKGDGLLWSYLQLHNYCREWGYASSQRLMPPVVNRQSTETNKGSRQLVLSRFPGICSQNVRLFIH